MNASKTEAARLWKSAADAGDLFAQKNLALMYLRGDGIPADKKAFVKYTLLAAENGDVDSLYNMGVVFETGDGVERDTERASEYYRRAAAKGHAEAVKRLERK